MHVIYTALPKKTPILRSFLSGNDPKFYFLRFSTKTAQYTQAGIFPQKKIVCDSLRLMILVPIYVDTG